ncbi:MAG: hypothetical protein IJB73_01590, partial [Firmicutes bacterium]|nr:hypothetical protein [Bacillota bacterium]
MSFVNDIAQHCADSIAENIYLQFFCRAETSTLLALAKEFDGKIRWAVMEADIDSTVDAQAMMNAGVQSVQLHTGGMCHLD